MCAWKTVRLFPTQTKRKHNTIIPSVFAQKWKTAANTKNHTGFLLWMQTDGIIIICFPFVCVGNSLHVFQANINVTCILTLFSWNTETIPSSDFPYTHRLVFGFLIAAVPNISHFLLIADDSHLGVPIGSLSLCV
jgi:hypothetical protein